MEFKRPFAEMRAYLDERPKVCEALINCWEPIQRIFGAGTTVVISLERDPDNVESIHADIQWPGEAEQARRMLTQLDNEWWLDICAGVAGELMFNYQLVEDVRP